MYLKVFIVILILCNIFEGVLINIPIRDMNCDTFSNRLLN